MKLEILNFSDAADIEPERSDMRALMPEPAIGDRIIGTRYKTLWPIKQDHTFWLGESSFSTMPTVKTEEWEKILIYDEGVVFWAWRNISTNLVFL